MKKGQIHLPKPTNGVVYVFHASFHALPYAYVLSSSLCTYSLCPPEELLLSAWRGGGLRAGGHWGLVAWSTVPKRVHSWICVPPCRGLGVPPNSLLGSVLFLVY